MLSWLFSELWVWCRLLRKWFAEETARSRTHVANGTRPLTALMISRSSSLKVMSERFGLRMVVSGAGDIHWISRDIILVVPWKGKQLFPFCGCDLPS